MELAGQPAARSRRVAEHARPIRPNQQRAADKLKPTYPAVLGGCLQNIVDGLGRSQGAEGAADIESEVLAATFAMSCDRLTDVSPITCGDRWSTMRRGLSRGSRLGEWMRERPPVGRRYTEMRSCIPSARVIRMSVAKVGLPSGASAL